MDLEAIKQIACKLMKNRRVHLEREIGGAYYHGEWVANTSLHLRKLIFPQNAANDDILMIAAWFHDVGKGIEPHNTYGTAIIKEALVDYCSKAELEEICDLSIRLHD